MPCMLNLFNSFVTLVKQKFRCVPCKTFNRNRPYNMKSLSPTPCFFITVRNKKKKYFIPRTKYERASQPQHTNRFLITPEPAGSYLGTARVYLFQAFNANERNSLCVSIYLKRLNLTLSSVKFELYSIELRSGLDYRGKREIDAHSVSKKKLVRKRRMAEDRGRDGRYVSDP